MKTDQELERLLRPTLSGRAGTVQRPATVPELRRRRPWWPVLAAAAAVIAIAVGLAVGTRSTDNDHPTPPATQLPTAVHTGSLDSQTRTACRIDLPVAWRSALTRGTQRFGAEQAMPLALSAEGDNMLVARDFGHARDVVDVDRAGHVHSIYQVPDPEKNQVQHASIDGTTAVIDLQYLPRNADGVLGTVREVILIDLRTGANRILDHVTDAQLFGKADHAESKTIDGSLVSGSDVYWDVRPSYGNNAGVIEDYNVATGRTRVVFSGNVLAPTLTANGISWYGSPDEIRVPSHVPNVVLAATGSLAMRETLITDGSAYAWLAAPGRIGWWAPGESVPTLITVPRGEAPELLAVTSHYVMYADDHSTSLPTPITLLDARSGAVMVLPAVQPFAYAGNGVIAGYAFTGRFKESATAVVRLDTAGLPALHC